jgi:hypothetical protein
LRFLIRQRVGRQFFSLQCSLGAHNRADWHSQLKYSFTEDYHCFSCEGDAKVCPANSIARGDGI